MKNPKYTLKSIYKDNKKSLKLNYKKKKQIPFKSFKLVILTYFKFVFNDLFQYGHETDIRTPLITGSFSIRKKIQTLISFFVADIALLFCSSPAHWSTPAPIWKCSAVHCQSGQELLRTTEESLMPELRMFFKLPLRTKRAMITKQMSTK